MKEHKGHEFEDLEEPTQKNMQLSKVNIQKSKYISYQQHKAWN